MHKPLQYSTKYIEERLKYEQNIVEKRRQGIYVNDYNFFEMVLKKLDERLKTHQYDYIIDSLRDLRTSYYSDGTSYLKIDVDTKKAKECYYLSALVSELIYAMVAKGFSHHCMDSGYPYDFKKRTFYFSQGAILANEYELALKIAGEDTLGGALILQDYERACEMLPESPEDESICRNEITQCMWALAHNDEKLFNKYIEKRIRVLRRQGKIYAVTLDDCSLVMIKLAQRRGISCNLNVIELPQQYLDDIRIDTSGLFLPMVDEINSILHK